MYPQRLSGPNRSRSRSRHYHQLRQRTGNRDETLRENLREINRRLPALRLTGTLGVDVIDELRAVPGPLLHAHALRTTYGRALRYNLDPTKYMTDVTPALQIQT